MVASDVSPPLWGGSNNGASAGALGSGGSLSGTLPAGAQHGATGGEWHTYGGDPGSTKYSPLEQINASNFNKLEVAWRFKTDAFGPFPEYKLEGTPIMVKGVLYTTAGTRRSVIALDGKRPAQTPKFAASGTLSWRPRERWLPFIGDVMPLVLIFVIVILSMATVLAERVRRVASLTGSAPARM